MLSALRSPGGPGGTPAYAEVVNRLFFGMSETQPMIGWNQPGRPSTLAAWKSRTGAAPGFTNGPILPPVPSSNQTRIALELARASVPATMNPIRCGQPKR